jgi:hypothetical protein
MVCSTKFDFVQEILVVIQAKFDKVKDEVNSDLAVVSEIYMISVIKTLFPGKRKGERHFFYVKDGKQILC